ncbi:peptidase inhibitor family I36 protein [Streptomyces niveus]|uniref:peptidase inhibitor family I36 protein n=1 Tax=Streptomyces niveus TaxID=193462 RepID=UPI0033DAD1D9
MEEVISMWKRTATLVATLALTATGMALSPTASAAEPCRAGGLCLYRNTGFINMQFVTERRGQCWLLADYGLENAVFSYRNNMSVYARFYNAAGTNVWNIRNGGSSSDSSSFSGEYVVCTD